MYRSRCDRPQQERDSIEYELCASQLSFLLSPPSSAETIYTHFCQSLRPTLFTFPSNATLQLILSQEDFISLAAKQSSMPTADKTSAHFELEGKRLDNNLEFASIISKDELVLVINDVIRLKIHKSESSAPDPATLDDHRQQMPNRLPTDDGVRPSFVEQHTYPNSSLDLLFDTLQGQLSYLFQYLQSHFGDRHEFTVYPIQQQQQQKRKQSQAKQWEEWETGIYKMRGDENGTVNIAVASDWGAGTFEAALVASAMVNGVDLSVPQKEATPGLPDYTIHLGDIYYVGLPTEVQHCCLGVKPPWAQRGVRWPIGQYGSFTIPGNHELYSRGFGYWDYFLPHLGMFDPKDLTKPVHPQTTSYWLLENEQWRVIGLDTGYDSFSLLFVDNSSIRLPEKLMDWLREVVGLSPQMTDKRGLLFFSHHQIVSAWDEKPYTEFPEQIASLLPEGRTVVYLWGHEHRLSFYEKQTTKPEQNTGKRLTFYGRCVGNSGFPTLATKLPVKARETKLLFYDDRLYSIQGASVWAGIGLGFNGYVTMKFVRPKQANDPSLYLSYKSLTLNQDGQLTDRNPMILVNEEWSVDSSGNVVLLKLVPLNEEITDNVHVQVTDLRSIFGPNQFGCCTTL